ncbi:MAG TPA: prolipoprotein diacylglyceryl transferase [Oscillospiraceae bacterium]|nr:prolipoprotein diacylglyceryl transferase [Oscillospiraceae bacterium]
MTDTVSFPGLGLEFEISRVAFSIGGMDIYWYAIIVATGFVLALFFAFRNFKEFGLDSDHTLDVVMTAAVLGIIGARLYYVAFRWDEYAGNLGAILNLRGGGLGFYGAVIGGALGAIIGCKWRGVKLLPFFDIGSAGLLIGQAIGRWGNFVNQEAFGTNTDLPWGMTSKGVAYYIASHTSEFMGAEMDPTKPVHPTFLYESLWLAAGFLIYVLTMKKRRYDGQMFLFYIGWNGFGRMWIEGLRTDSLMLGGMRVSQVLGALLALTAVIANSLILSKIRREHDPAYMKLYRDTEESKLILAGQWDYKAKAPKSSEEPVSGKNAPMPSEEDEISAKNAPEEAEPPEGETSEEKAPEETADSVSEEEPGAKPSEEQISGKNDKD